MNIHNLIHIVDDVVNMKAPLSQFSAFDFENSLGFIKTFLKSPTNPIAQIQRKLHIFHSNSSENNIPLLYPLTLSTKYCLGNVKENFELKVSFSYVNINGFKVTVTHPDNVCLLKNGYIFLVKEIVSKKLHKYKPTDIFLKGNIFRDVSDFFEYPMRSKEIGLYNVKNLDKNIVEFNIHKVEKKIYSY